MALVTLLALSMAGCGGYRPVRRPSEELFHAQPWQRPPIRLPSQDLAQYPSRVSRDGVDVVAELINPQQTRETFSLNLVPHGIQPLLVIIHNGTPRTLLFKKANVDRRYIPARRVARRAYIPPYVTALRQARWIALVPVGLAFHMVIEPTSTLDFPGIHDLTQRPPTPDNRAIRAEFERQEIPDGPIEPDHTISGALFVRPIKLGSVLEIPLLDAQTLEPVRIDVVTPPAKYVAEQRYPQSWEMVQDAARLAIKQIPSWRLIAEDRQTGTFSVRRGVRCFGWGTATQMTITVQREEDLITTAKAKKEVPSGVELVELETALVPTEPVVTPQTRVIVESSLQRGDSRAYGVPTLTISRFLSNVESNLPPAPPKPPAASEDIATATTEPTAPTEEPAASYAPRL